MAPAREDILSLPNLLTLARVGTMPVLVALIYLDGVWAGYAAGALFFLAGLTDLADGWVARRMKQVSLLGQFLDPVADKLLVSALLVALVDMGHVAGWMAMVIICRELAVTGMRAVASSQGFMVPSDFLGKSKTAVQMMAILLLILPPNALGFDNQLWGGWVLWAALVITVWSGGGYMLRFHRRLTAGSDG